MVFSLQVGDAKHSHEEKGKSQKEDPLQLGFASLYLLMLLCVCTVSWGILWLLGASESRMYPVLEAIEVSLSLFTGSSQGRP